MLFDRDSLIKIYLFILLIFTIVLFYIIDISKITFSSDILIITLLGVFASVILFILSKQTYIHLKNNYFRISTLFLIGYLIVFFQRYVDVIIGNVDPNNWSLFVSSKLINKCALLSLAGLLCFIIGYLFYKPPISISSHSTTLPYIPVKWLNYFLFIAVLLFIYNYGFYYLTSIYSQEFLDNNKGTAMAYFNVFIRSLILSVLIIHTIYRKENNKSVWKFIKSLGLLFHLSLFSYIGLFLLTGQRGEIIICGSAYFFAFILKVRPRIKIFHFIILFIISSFGFTIIGIVRQMDSTLAFHDRVITVINENTIDQKNSIINSTAELSSSIRSLHYSMNYVPDKHPYLYGSFQLRELLSVIPFSGLITKHFLDNSFKYRSSAAFITYINQGEYFYKRGDGSNVVADLYLSFGVLGVIFGLLLFGIFIKKIEVVIFKPDFSKIPLIYYCLAFSYISTAISIPRHTLLSPLQDAFFSFLIIILYTSFFRYLKYFKLSSLNIGKKVQFKSSFIE